MTEKKKIAIITTHHEPNFGNKLQNYALQTILQSLGFLVETINDARSWPDLTSWWVQRKVILHYLIRYRTLPKHIKYAKFFFWSKKHIRYSKVNVHSDEDMQGLAEKYDYFVVGSDQIWNPEDYIFSNNFGFASFANENQKIAYAPSLGVTKIPKERMLEYQNWLKKWKALSCREDEGALVIATLAEREVPVVVDPTLLYTGTFWSALASKNDIKEPYLVLYTIGELLESYKDYVEQISRVRRLKIVDLNKGKYSGIGPNEFLGIIMNAKLVVTDSFHGSLFALQFHIPLVIYKRVEREHMDQFSRLRTLFRHAGIEPRDFTKPINEYFDIDWNNVEINFANIRDISLNYLKKNLL